jgi:hypothetical protein
MRLREGIAAAAAVASLAGMASACDSGAHRSNAAAHETTTTAAGIPGGPDAASICEVAPYGRGDYSGHIGSYAMAPVGVRGADSHYTYGTAQNPDTPDTAAQEVAQKIAPNDLALALVWTIIKGETGVTPTVVATEASKTMYGMEDSASTRSTICVQVVGRLLKDPELLTYQSSTGLVADYQPGYDHSTPKQLVDIQGPSAPNDAAVEVFNIKAESGSKNFTLEQAISQSWGIEADGELIETSNVNGNFKVALEGSPVQPNQSQNPAGASSANQNATNQSQNPSRSGGGGVTTGSVLENQNGTSNGNASGGTGGSTGTGSTPEGTGTGTHPSPSGGGGGGGTPTPNTAPPQTTPNTAPPQTTPNTAPPQTTPNTTPPTTVVYPGCPATNPVCG